jgi:uncharacterized protein YecE (DUF72 family)
VLFFPPHTIAGMALFLGCPMWGLKTWVGPFFPAGTKQRDFLAAYSRRLNTVEGNTTFYALPDAATVQRWRDETPAGFRFCFKVPQEISHRRRLVNADDITADFIDRLHLLGDRRGPAFLQLPPTFSAPHLPQLAAFLQKWPPEFQLAVEPRHADFFGRAEADFESLLREHHAVRCVFDTTALFSLAAATSDEVHEAQARKPKFAVRRPPAEPFSFTRFVAMPEVPANETWLAPWAAHVAEGLRGGRDVYFFLHHPDDTHAPAVARLMHRLISQHVDVPALPEWGEDGGHEAPAQASLF